MTTKVLDFNNIERKLFWILAGALAVCLAFYLYSVLSLTVNVVERDRALGMARTLATEAGDLESEYLTRQNAITLAAAHDLGFKEVSAKFTGDTAPKLSLAR